MGSLIFNLKKIYMLFYIIAPIITFWLMYWLSTVPRTVEVKRGRYSSDPITYGPYGLPLWLLLVIILLAIIPIGNIIATAIFIIVKVVKIVENKIPYEEAFRDSKIMKSLNRRIK